MITDVHTHIWETPDQLGRGAAKHIRRHVKQPWDRPDASVSAHEAAMAPVHAVLVHGFESRYLGASVPAKQVANHVARNPDKYIGFAGVDPLGDFKSQIAEAKQLGLVGVTISPAGQGCHPSHSRAMKVYQLCVDAGMPVFVHPATHLGADAKLEYAQPFLFDEVAREFPSLRIIIGQIGYPWIDQGLALVGKHDHVYAELSNVVSRPWQLYNALLTAHQLGVTDHLLFGSDYPFCTPEKAITTIYSVNTLTQGTPLPSVPREKLRSIVERDVLACLGLAAPRTVDDEVEDDANDATAKAGVVSIASGNGRDTSAPVAEKTKTVAPVKQETTPSEQPDAADTNVPPKTTAEPASELVEAPVDTTQASPSDENVAAIAEDQTPSNDNSPDEAEDSPSISGTTDSDSSSSDKPVSDASVSDTSLPLTPPPIPVAATEDVEVDGTKPADASPTPAVADDSLATDETGESEAEDRDKARDEDENGDGGDADEPTTKTDGDHEASASNDADALGTIDATQPKKESDA